MYLTLPNRERAQLVRTETCFGCSNGCQQAKWIDFQNQRTATAMEIPLYSNAYFDFFITALRDYTPAVNSNWADAILRARLSDYEEEEEAEGEELPEEDDDSFFED